MNSSALPYEACGTCQNAIDAMSFKTLAEVSPAGIWRITRDGYCTYVNRAWEEATGFGPSEWQGHGWADAIHPDDRDRVFAAWSDAVSRGEEFRDEWRWQRSDGAAPWVLCVGSPEYDAQGNVIAYVGINIDITRNRQLASELDAARERAERAASAKSSFLANMSHEIRTPMNGVIGFTDLLLASSLDAQQQHHAEMIATSGRAMMSLLNDILDLSKIEAGLLAVEQVEFDLRHKAMTCLRMVEPTASKKGLKVALAVDPGLPPTIVGDPLRFRQILLNLLGNAVKFTEEGSIAVKLSRRTASEGQRLTMAVRDTGIGIAEEQLETIFHPFEQGDGTIARKHGGSGLGLSISRQLAEMMGGTLAVQSEPGRGSTFTVELPLHAAGAEVPGPVQAASPANRLPARRILVAEDHDINQYLIMEMAARAGLQPTLAVNGADAIAAVRAASESGRPFDAVLMDIQMPEMDGLEATRRLREEGFARPILALTANCYPEDIEACLEAGMQGHVGKPLKIADLIAALSRVWDDDLGGAPSSDWAARHAAH